MIVVVEIVLVILFMFFSSLIFLYSCRKAFSLRHL
nr:MAG TPA: hypothetical protein [Caudoviricetes sp.]